jgi:hypothetical protein
MPPDTRQLPILFVGECTAALGGSLGTERQRLRVLSARDRRPSDTDRRLKFLEALISHWRMEEVWKGHKPWLLGLAGIEAELSVLAQVDGLDRLNSRESCTAAASHAATEGCGISSWGRPHAGGTSR